MLPSPDLASVLATHSIHLRGEDARFYELEPIEQWRRIFASMSDFDGDDMVTTQSRRCLSEVVKPLLSHLNVEEKAFLANELERVGESIFKRVDEYKLEREPNDNDKKAAGFSHRFMHDPHVLRNVDSDLIARNILDKDWDDIAVDNSWHGELSAAILAGSIKNSDLGSQFIKRILKESQSWQLTLITSLIDKSEDANLIFHDALCVASDGDGSRNPDKLAQIFSRIIPAIQYLNTLGIQFNEQTINYGDRFILNGSKKAYLLLMRSSAGFSVSEDIIMGGLKEIFEGGRATDIQLGFSRLLVGDEGMPKIRVDQKLLKDICANFKSEHSVRGIVSLLGETDLTNGYPILTTNMIGHMIEAYPEACFDELTNLKPAFGGWLVQALVEDFPEAGRKSFNFVRNPEFIRLIEKFTVESPLDFDGIHMHKLAALALEHEMSSKALIGAVLKTEYGQRALTSADVHRSNIAKLTPKQRAICIKSDFGL